jgi:transcriptional regulator with XRE-family HTH domain
MNCNLLKSKRVLKGFTQREIAEKLGVTEKTYNHKEQGKVVFKPTEIVITSGVLGLTISEVNEIFFNNNLPNV